MACIQEVSSLYLSHNTYNPDWDISRSPSVPLCKCQDVTTNQTMSVAFHISHNSLFIINQAHIDQMMSKLNSACFVIQTIQGMMSQETLRMVYCAYVHSIMSYGIILGGETNHIARKFSKFKRGWSELLQIQELENHVGNCLKNFKYCPYIHNIFFLYQYLW